MQFIKLLLLCLLACPAWATYTLTQVKSNTGCSSTSNCVITVTSTGTGHVIVVGFLADANVTISSVSGGGTYTLCGAPCRTGNATAGWVDMAYTLASTSGATSVSLTVSAGGYNGVGVAWEVSTTGTPSFDTSSAILDTANCTSCAGVGLTLGGSNDFIAQIASCGGSCTAVSGTGWTNDLANPGGDGAVHSLNATTGTAPTITQSPTSNLAVAAVAIKDAAGTSKLCTMGLLGAGPC